MLSKFTVKNFKNFEKSFCIDFSQTKSYEFSKDCVKNGIVKTGLIYGPNSIGKSNLGKAIFDIVGTLTDKEKVLEFYKTYQNAFKPNEPVEFCYEFCFGDSKVVYRYKKAVYVYMLNEELSIDGKIVVSRNGGDTFDTSLEGLETLKRTLTPMMPALRYIRTNGTLSDNSQNAIVLKFFDFVNRMLMVQNVKENLYQGYFLGPKIVDVEILQQNKLLELEAFLNSVEVKCKLISLEINGEKRICFDFDGNVIDFWANASTGTKALVHFYFWYLEALKGDATAPSFMYLDEFDAFYHEKTSETVVKMLRKLDCQVILTTHDTTLLSNDCIRPDCAFNMTEEYRNAEGYVLGPLSSVVKKDLREAHNIPKMFRAKAFG